MIVSIIGTGNVAWHLNKTIAEAGIEIKQVLGRKEKSILQLTQISDAEGITDFDALKAVDVVILAVNDDAISAVAESIPESIRRSCIVVHTSGTQSIETLQSCDHPGIFYPLQTFTKGISLNFRNIPVCLNGTSETIAHLRKLAEKITDDVRVLSDKERKQAHLSAVIINNFTNHLIYLAKERLDAQDIDSSIIDPLLQETVRKQMLLSSYEAQTGPARRDDQHTIAAHLKMLEHEPALVELYNTLSKSIIKTYTCES